MVPARGPGCGRCRRTNHISWKFIRLRQIVLLCPIEICSRLHHLRQDIHAGSRRISYLYIIPSQVLSTNGSMTCLIGVSMSSRPCLFWFQPLECNSSANTPSIRWRLLTENHGSANWKHPNNCWRQCSWPYIREQIDFHDANRSDCNGQARCGHSPNFHPDDGYGDIHAHRTAHP